MNGYENTEALKRAPYAKISGWMAGGLKLSGQALTAFALLWERSHPTGEDSGRIDARYIAEACGVDGNGLYKVLSGLVGKELVTFSFDAADTLGAYMVDDEAVLAKVNGSGSRE